MRFGASGIVAMMPRLLVSSSHCHMGSLAHLSDQKRPSWEIGLLVGVLIPLVGQGQIPRDQVVVSAQVTAEHLHSCP